MGLRDDIGLTLQPWKWFSGEGKRRILSNESIGNPLHGLKAGYKVFDLAKPWRPYEDIKTWKEQGLSKGLKTTVGRHKDAWGDVAEENWPVAAVAGAYYGAPYLAGALGGGGAAGAGAAPFGFGPGMSLEAGVPSIAGATPGINPVASGFGASSAPSFTAGKAAGLVGSGVGAMPYGNQPPWATPGINPNAQGPFAEPRFNGGLFGDDPQAAGDARMAAAAALLMSSGYQPTKTTNSEAIGRALMAAQQAKAQALEAAQKKRYQDAQIAAMEREKERSPFGTVSPSDFTPESLAEFQQTGDFSVLKRDPTGGMGRYNPGQYTPESWAVFLQTNDPADLVRYVTPANPNIVTTAGGQEIITPSRTGGAPSRVPLTTKEDEIAAAEERKRREAEATAKGTIAGEVFGAIQKKGANAEVIGQTLDLADPLIDVATGSTTGAAADMVAGFFGKSLDGAQAIAQLKVLQAGLILNAPRLEGPQGVLDLKLYETAAGQIGDPNVPAETKKAAVRTIRALQAKYRENAAPKDAGKDPLGIR